MFSEPGEGFVDLAEVVGPAATYAVVTVIFYSTGAMSMMDLKLIRGKSLFAKKQDLFKKFHESWTLNTF